jgi:hypothetical protein
MNTYWIVRKDGVIVAAIAERFYKDIPSELISDLKEMAHSGPIELIMTTGSIKIGDEFQA